MGCGSGAGDASRFEPGTWVTESLRGWVTPTGIATLSEGAVARSTGMGDRLDAGGDESEGMSSRAAGVGDARAGMGGESKGSARCELVTARLGGAVERAANRGDSRVVREGVFLGARVDGGAVSRVRDLTEVLTAEMTS